MQKSLGKQWCDRPPMPKLSVYVNCAGLSATTLALCIAFASRTLDALVGHGF
jgi:hypothetical protein